MEQICYVSTRTANGSPLVFLMFSQGFEAFSVNGVDAPEGFYINPVPPEQAAAFLHETEVDLTSTPKR